MAHTVLLIDDIPHQCDALSSFLEDKLGYRVTAVSSARNAIHSIETSAIAKPDIILLDWGALEDSEAQGRLRMLSLHAPLLALVKYGDYDAAKMALESGAQDFLTKPVAPERISITFRNALLLRDARNELEQLRTQRLRANATAFSIVNTISDPSGSVFLDANGHVRRLCDMEAESIRFAMQYYHGRMTEVARRLGIGRSTLYRKLNELGDRQTVAA